MNRRLVKLISEVNTDRIKEATTEKEKLQKEKFKQDSKGKKKKKIKAEDMRADAPQFCQTKFGEKEREYHEAYQVLLAEHLKRKALRKKQARMQAIREKERVEVKNNQDFKSPAVLKREIDDFLKVTTK